tara:strand:- start:74 stop:763 length:690 start_codon:yes stop_codon:yes gene_type:complete
MIYHYVYRVTSLINNKHYYGLRTSKIEPILDLGIKYFTSSRSIEFKDDFKQNTRKYKCIIVRVFNNRKDASLFEILLHNKFNVGISDKFYNKVKATEKRCDMTGFKHTESTLIKMSEAGKGREPWNKGLIKPYNKATLIKMSEAAKGREPVNKNKKGLWKPSSENLLNLSNAMKGRTLTEEHKRSLSKPKKHTKNYSYTKEIVKCPHCDKSGGIGAMGRWHFDNCKNKT